MSRYLWQAQFFWPKRGTKRICSTNNSLNKAENADLKLVVVEAKNIEISSFLTDLLKNDAILVINKSDLLKDSNLEIEIQGKKRKAKILHKVVYDPENKKLTA